MNKVYIMIAAAFIVVGAAYILYTKRAEAKKFFESPETKDFIKKLIISAEHEIVGTKKGQERLALCVSRLLLCVPPQIKMYVTEDMMVQAINKIFTAIAVKMADGTTKAVEDE